MAGARGKSMSATRGGASRGVRALALIFVVVALGLLVVAAPALIVLVVGMVPTAVALFIDRDPEKFSAISVAALNFAGVSPYLVDLVFGEATFGHAFALVSNVFVLVVIYGAAAAGWVLVLALPPLVAIVLRFSADARIEALRKEQRQLVDDWGEDVAAR